MLDTLLKELLKTTIKEAVHEAMSSDAVKNLVVNVFGGNSGSASKVGETSDSEAAKFGQTNGADVTTLEKRSEPKGTGDKDTKASIPTDHTPSVDAETLRAESLAIIDLLAPSHGRELRALLGTYGAKRLKEVAESDLPALLAGLEALKDAK